MRSWGRVRDWRAPCLQRPRKAGKTRRTQRPVVPRLTAGPVRGPQGQAPAGRPAPVRGSAQARAQVRPAVARRGGGCALLRQPACPGKSKLRARLTACAHHRRFAGGRQPAQAPGGQRAQASPFLVRRSAVPGGRWRVHLEPRARSWQAPELQRTGVPRKNRRLALARVSVPTRAQARPRAAQPAGARPRESRRARASRSPAHGSPLARASSPLR